MISIDLKIIIKASIENVWRVFTDPAVTRKMGGEYVSEWKVGNSFSWRNLDGKIITNGKILSIETGRLIEHSLLDSNEKQNLLSVISYRFKENKEETLLTIKEELQYEITNEQLKDAADGWDFALNAIKEIAEKL